MGIRELEKHGYRFHEEICKTTCESFDHSKKSVHYNKHHPFEHDTRRNIVGCNCVYDKPRGIIHKAREIPFLACPTKLGKLTDLEMDGHYIKKVYDDSDNDYMYYEAEGIPLCFR